jgi:hypothetical protein
VLLELLDVLLELLLDEVVAVIRISWTVGFPVAVPPSGWYVPVTKDPDTSLYHPLMLAGPNPSSIT